MSAALVVPTEVMKATTSDGLRTFRARSESWRSENISLSHDELTDETLNDLVAASGKIENASFGRVASAILNARAGKNNAIPSFAAAPAMLIDYLRRDMIDGWVYLRSFDGRMSPWLVTKIRIEEGRGPGQDSFVSVSLTADHPVRSPRQETVTINKSFSFAKGDVTKKTPSQVFLSNGMVKETPELRAAYMETKSQFEAIMATGFRQQFWFSGNVQRKEYGLPEERSRRRVVHDVPNKELAVLREKAVSVLSPEEEGVLPVPVSTVLRVFDLGDGEPYMVHVSDLSEYVYDLSLRDKLILPDDQRELLDVLTTDTQALTGDLIEGKSAGNVILAKGRPGVGKTLTAEVYAELVKRPLYAIHSGTLGTTPESVRAALESAFQVAKRLNLVLLLDEADVFVLERGDSIQQNAVCAEFLRTLEYFDGLLFMTTNRADSIDDAILSRCAAIIDYQAPGEEDARRIWKVLAALNEVTLSEDLLDTLLEALPGISPRDMKMLLRLTVRMAVARGEDLSAEQFARCAMFRGLHFRTDALVGQ